MLSTRPLDDHPFALRPQRTFAALSLPILLSLVAEPMTGLVDTAFIARLGAAELAALGAATALWPLLPALAEAMGARDAAGGLTVAYLEIRLLGAPAELVLVAAFGALRGLQDVRTPLWIAAGLNLVNVALDPLLIFGMGPIPALGVAGAAWATSASQWLGAVWAVAALRRRVGLSLVLHRDIARRLLVVGRDMAVRTGALNLFLLLATRAATRLGPEAGAAHQAVRQTWSFTALLLDAHALTAQSLVGYFLAAGRIDLARRAAAVACAWSAGTAAALAVGMVLGYGGAALLLVPPEARNLLAGAWFVGAACQPLAALGFATDGIHWGAGDWRYLRNAMLAATAAGVGGLLWLETSGAATLTGIWAVTGAWLALRAGFGVVRLWPGAGRAPLGSS